MGLALDLASFVSTVKVDGQEENNFLAPVHRRSEDYKAAERRVRFDLTRFVGEVTARRFYVGLQSWSNGLIGKRSTKAASSPSRPAGC